MRTFPEIARIAIVLPLLGGCSSTHRAAPIPAEAAVCIPSDTLALAGLRLERLRATPLDAALPAAWRALLEPLRDATDVWIAYNGRDLLVIAQGHFSSAPAGAVLLGPALALAGAPDAIQAATAQRKTGRTGAPRLVAEAAPATRSPIWAVVERQTSVPFGGNFANLNRLLRLVDYATLTVDLDSRADIRVTGVGRNEGETRQLEESLRALLTLAGASAKDPEVLAILRSAQVSRNGSTVVATLSVSTTALENLLR